MNLRNLSSKGRALVEALTEPASDEGFEVFDVDEDEDGIVVTFRRDPASADDDADEEEEDDES